MSKKELHIVTATEHALQYLGYWPKVAQSFRHEEWDEEKWVKCSECGHRGKLTIHVEHDFLPDHPGRPDVIVPNPRAAEGGLGYFEMEVKAVLKNELRFNFSDISDNQYKYMNNWVNAGGFGYLAVGKIIETPHGTAIHSIYVIPWDVYLAMKKKCEDAAETGLPYSMDLYKRLPTGMLNDIGFFVPSWCVLSKDADGEFHFHPEHPIAWGLTEVETPFFKRNRKEKV